MRKWTRRSGMNIMEVTIILLVLVLLAGAITPTAMRSIRRSKRSRARSDVCAIKDAILNMLADVDADGLVQNAALPLAEHELVELVVGDGDIPELGPDGSAEWVQPVNYTTVDFLGNHIITNMPGDSPAHAYRDWFGAYIASPIDPDPWGNRYMVNVLHFCDASTYDTVVLSAGPDEEVDSQFDQDGFVPGDDDIICLITGRSTCAVGECLITFANYGCDVIEVYAEGELVATITNGLSEELDIPPGYLVQVYDQAGIRDEFTVTGDDCGTAKEYICEVDQCDEGEKPAWMLFKYTGEDCSASNNTQDPAQWSCTDYNGGPNFTSPVRIVVASSPQGDIYFDGIVELNENFVADAANAGDVLFKSNITIDIYDLSDNLLQSIRIHTSCSQPLIPGEQFGSVILLFAYCI